MFQVLQPYKLQGNARYCEQDSIFLQLCSQTETVAYNMILSKTHHFICYCKMTYFSVLKFNFELFFYKINLSVMSFLCSHLGSIPEGY